MLVDFSFVVKYGCQQRLQETNGIGVVVVLVVKYCFGVMAVGVVCVCGRTFEDVFVFVFCLFYSFSSYS